MGLTFSSMFPLHAFHSKQLNTLFKNTFSADEWQVREGRGKPDAYLFGHPHKGFKTFLTAMLASPRL